jgi:hypothetical protein
MNLGSLNVAARPLVTGSCSQCGNPVYPDEGYHAVSGRHWDCELQVAATLPIKDGIHNPSVSAFRG